MFANCYKHLFRTFSSYITVERSELHASPHIHIGHNHIWIRQYGSVLYMWASMKFLPGGTDMKVWGPILGNALPY